MLQDRFLEKRSQTFQPLQPNKKIVTCNFPCMFNAELSYTLNRLKYSKH